MIRRALLVSLVVVSLTGSAVAEIFDHEHQAWTSLLERYVQNDGAVGGVDYRRMSAEQASLDAYLEGLSLVTVDAFDAWTADQRLAFLINAYNALTVKLILDHYPIGSIKDLGGWFSSPWKKRFFQLLGKERHLDDIEHGMIRENFKEPRIHFAVNCASRGCPPLRTEAFVAQRLDEQLEDSTRTFLRDQRRNRYLPGRAVLELSPLLDWYRDDFSEHFGSVQAFVAERITDEPAIVTALRSRSICLRFLDYDWSLNDRSGETGIP